VTCRATDTEAVKSDLRRNQRGSAKAARIVDRSIGRAHLLASVSPVCAPSVAWLTGGMKNRESRSAFRIAALLGPNFVSASRTGLRSNETVVCKGPSPLAPLNLIGGGAPGVQRRHRAITVTVGTDCCDPSGFNAYEMMARMAGGCAEGCESVRPCSGAGAKGRQLLPRHVPG